MRALSSPKNLNELFQKLQTAHSCYFNFALLEKFVKGKVFVPYLGEEKVN